MKRDRQRPSCLNQTPRSFHVDRSIEIDEAKHNSVSAETLCGRDIVTHSLKFKVRIMKIAASRPNHDMDITSQLLARNSDQALTRCYATLDWIAKQFDAIRSSGFGSNGRFEGMHRNFDSDLLRSRHRAFGFGIVTSRNFS